VISRKFTINFCKWEKNTSLLPDMLLVGLGTIPVRPFYLSAIAPVLTSRKNKEKMNVDISSLALSMKILLIYCNRFFG